MESETFYDAEDHFDEEGNWPRESPTVKPHDFDLVTNQLKVHMNIWNKRIFHYQLNERPTDRSKLDVLGAYDGGLDLYTFKAIPETEFPVIFKGNFSIGHDSKRELVMHVLNMILRQHAEKKYDMDDAPYLGGGLVCAREYNPIFRTIGSELSVIMDSSMATFVHGGSVVHTFLAHQDVKDRSAIDWAQAKEFLLNLLITYENNVYTISDLIPDYCGVGTSTQDYFPLERCFLLPMQRNAKALTKLQKDSLAEKSRQNPKERLERLKNAARRNSYKKDTLLHTLLQACGVSVSNSLTEVKGHILKAPWLRLGNEEDFYPSNGRWNFNNKKLVDPKKIENWVVVNFSASCNTQTIVDGLISCGRKLGMTIDQPNVYEESPLHISALPLVRVEKMFELIKESHMIGALEFLLCILPERKQTNSVLYGSWKRKNFAEYGTVTQCIAPTPPTKINDRYLKYILLKINAKLGGLNSKLSLQHFPATSLVTNTSTMILGMHVSHDSTKKSSIVAVVGSRQWPSKSKYRASVRTQSRKVQMIDSLCKRVSDSTNDDGIMRELLLEFYNNSDHTFPSHIIIFRNGASESQFDQVLNVELKQIIESCHLLKEEWKPKFVFIVVNKSHGMRFFPSFPPHKLPSGMVISDPTKDGFFLCSQKVNIGTARLTHYHVLLDQVGFSTNDLQGFVHSLCYDSQRSTSALSVVAPIYYARLAASQVSKYIKVDDMLSGGGVTTAAAAAGEGGSVPKLCKKLSNSPMFFV